MAQRPGSGGSGGGSGGADTTLTKIFVGGLAWETQCETMRRYFEQFGDILEAVIITDKNTGRSRGYGFVTFRDPDSAYRACQDPAPVIDGRRTNCNLAALGAQQRPRGPASAVFQGPRFFPFIGDYGAHVYPGPPHFGQPLAYPFQQGVPFHPPFGYHGYGPEFYGPQAMYGPFLGPQLPAATMFSPASPTFQQQQHQQQEHQQLQPPPSGFGRPPPSPPHHALISPYHLVPIPFPSPPGVLSPTTGGPMPSPPRFVLPPQSPQQPFTPGGSSEHSSG